MGDLPPRFPSKERPLVISAYFANLARSLKGDRGYADWTLKGLDEGYVVEMPVMEKPPSDRMVVEGPNRRTRRLNG
jgi:hypothetical protein